MLTASALGSSTLLILYLLLTPPFAASCSRIEKAEEDSNFIDSANKCTHMYQVIDCIVGSTTAIANCALPSLSPEDPFPGKKV